MLGRSTKARLQARLNNDLESRLKLIYKNILMKSKEPGALLQDIRDITNDTDRILLKKQILNCYKLFLLAILIFELMSNVVYGMIRQRSYLIVPLLILRL
jgi:hypothetical protein